MSQTITLELPDTLYQSATWLAQATQRPLADVLQESLAVGLPPLDDVLPEEATELAALSHLEDGALWQVAQAHLTADEAGALEALLAEQGAGTLTAAEHAQLQGLLDRYGRLLVRQAHAWLLLARRGYRVPPQGA